MYQAGLVLEGGGMKGVYTAGVLDFFLDKGLLFSSVYGVSAGACHMCSYLSNQRGRALDISIDYLDSRKYCSVHSFLTTGDLFNVNTAYHLIPDYLNPYDYQAFDRYEGKAYAVVTNIITGRAEYLRIQDMKKTLMRFVRRRHCRLYPATSELAMDCIWMAGLRMQYPSENPYWTATGKM